MLPQRPWRNDMFVPPRMPMQSPPSTPTPTPWLPPPPYAAAMGPYGAFPYYYGVAMPIPLPLPMPMPMPMPAVQTTGVHVQTVTAANFAAELDLIGSQLPRYSYFVVDTEYPGTVHRPPPGRREVDLTPDERYALVKANVDELPIVQLGLTLCDAQGSLPVVFDHYGGGYGYGYGYGHAVERAWEFTFSDFDASRDRHAPESVEFLRSQGVDFASARACGVSSAAFKEKLAGILSSAVAAGVELKWVAFSGAYDLAYLVKMLGDGQPLPETRQEFVALVRELLGGRVFDAKHMADHCGRADLRGRGLRSVAANLGVHTPTVGLPWLAGAKSLAACQIHTVMMRHVLSHDAAAVFEGLIDGLQ